MGLALFSKLASHARPISENVWVYVPPLHRLTANDFASKLRRTAAAFGRGSDTAARTGAAPIARLVEDAHRCAAAAV